MQNRNDSVHLPLPWKILNGSNDFRRDFARIFDDAFFENLAPGTADRNGLRRGIEAAVRTYLAAQRELRHRKPLKYEAKHIEAVAEHATKLAGALEKIAGFGNADHKIASRVAVLAESQDGRGAALLALAREREGPADPTRSLREIVALLARTAAAESVATPGETREARDARRQAYYQRDHADWKARTKPRPTHPLYALARAFRPVWEAHWNAPFTPGMYYREVGGTLSPTVSALASIARRLDPTVTDAQIRTAIRIAAKE